MDGDDSDDNVVKVPPRKSFRYSASHATTPEYTKARQSMSLSKQRTMHCPACQVLVVNGTYGGAAVKCGECIIVCPKCERSQPATEYLYDSSKGIVRTEGCFDCRTLRVSLPKVSDCAALQPEANRRKRPNYARVGHDCTDLKSGARLLQAQKEVLRLAGEVARAENIIQGWLKTDAVLERLSQRPDASASVPLTPWVLLVRREADL